MIDANYSPIYSVNFSRPRLHVQAFLGSGVKFFFRMNLSFELFPLCYSNFNSTAVEFRITSSWPLNSEYSVTYTGFNEYSHCDE